MQPYTCRKQRLAATIFLSVIWKMFKTRTKGTKQWKRPFLIAWVTPFQKKFVSATIRTHNLENVGSKTCYHWSTVPTIHCTSWYQNVLNKTKAIFFQNQKCLFSRDKKIRDIRKILKWHSCDHGCCKTSLAGTIFCVARDKVLSKVIFVTKTSSNTDHRASM